MNISQNNNEVKTPKKKNGVNVAILIFVILTFIATSLICADTVYTKYSAYKTGEGIANSIQDEKADTQGNLGNFNVISRKNTISDNGGGSYTLTLEFLFTNYGKEGRSFNEAVDVTAYQNNKEVESTDTKLDLSIFGDGNQNRQKSFASNEADLKVRNGQSADVVLNYIVKDLKQDVNVEMKSGDDSFTYTVKLGDSAAVSKQSGKKETTTKKENTTTAKEN